MWLVFVLLVILNFLCELTMVGGFLVVVVVMFVEVCVV